MLAILLFIGGSEIILILLVILLLFGSKSFPELAKMLGKANNEFNKVKDDIEQELKNDIDTSDIDNNIQEIINNELEKDSLNSGN